MLDLLHDGFGNCQITREIRSNPSFVQEVKDHYNNQNTFLRDIRVGFPSPKINAQVVEYITVEVQKLMKPSTDSTKLQQRLLLDGMVHLLRVSHINKDTCTEPVMTRKKLTSIPLVSTTPEATTAINDFPTKVPYLPMYKSY